MKKTIALLSLLGVMTFALSLNVVFAAELEGADEAQRSGIMMQRGDSSFGQGVNMKKHKKNAPSQEMLEALENDDYEAFIALGEGLRADISEEEFEMMVEAHKLIEAGEYEKAKEIRDLLKEEMDKKREAHRVLVEEAIDSQGFIAYVDLLGEDSKILEFVNEDNFYLLKELKDAKDLEDFERVQEIREELNLPKFKGNKKF